METCEKCEKRKRCVALCSKVDAYASQDHVPMYEFIHSSGNETEEVEHEEGFNCGYDTFYTATMTRIKYIVIMLHRDGKDLDTINYHVPISEQEVRKIIKKYKRNYKKYSSRYVDDAIINM